MSDDPGGRTPIPSTRLGWPLRALAKDGVDERVLALAERIKAAQTPEIEQMTTWLQTWGEPVPDTTGSGSMDGMAMT